MWLKHSLMLLFALCLFVGCGPDRSVSTWLSVTESPLPAGGILRGYIVNQEGEPIEGAEVVRTVLDQNVPLDAIMIVTDRDGYYQVGLRPARYKIVVIARGYLSQTELIDLESGQDLVLDFELKLQ